MANKIVFGTDGWREKYDLGFNFENLKIVTYALIKYVKEFQFDKKNFIIGYDGRKNAFGFAKFTSELLNSFGFNVQLSKNICPTPVIAYTAKEKNALGIMFTASHNPKDYLGFKFIPAYGGPATDDITNKIMDNINFFQNDYKNIEAFEKLISKNSISQINLTSFKKSYFQKLESLIDFEKIKKLNKNIIIDFLHSASIGYFDEILNKHDILYKKINDNFDPDFGGKLPDPKPENLVDLIKTVKQSNNTLGLSNDGDADRYGVINELGKWVNPNEIICILLKHLIKYKNASGYLIKTIASSSLLNIFAKKLNVPILETKVGFKWLGLEMRNNNTIIAGEESGGLSIGSHIPEKDGILANLLILEALAYSKKTLVELQNEVKNIAGYSFINDRVDIHLNKDFNFNYDIFINIFNKDEIHSISNLEGLKIVLDNGLSWILIRKSGTEPLLRIYFESFNIDNLNKLKKTVQLVINTIKV